jgi:putative ABC transport system ATP-binding protein
MEAIAGESLWKTYGRGDTEIVALRDVTLRVARGEVVALLGPSGSGKSTLLTTLGLLQLPDRGAVRITGELVIDAGQARRDLAELRRERLGFVFQKANLVPFLSAIENVVVAFTINGVSDRTARDKAVEILGYLGLDDRMHHMPEQLSGGQQQRVAIARALAMAPAVVLADEPTAALDSARGRDVMQLFRRVAHERGAAVVVVTHDHRTLDAFDTVYEMEDGVLLPHHAESPPATEEVA